MVAVFTGLGAGFERGSGAALGGMGLLGSSSLGRAGEGVFLNAATGNLLINRQDEFLVGRGPDVAIARTYNSQGALDDNGDNWRQSTDRRVHGLTGTVNTAGSTIKRVSADGSEITYTWNGSYYATTEGAGAHDKLIHSAGDWTWTDGSTQVSELYKVADGGHISEVYDTERDALNQPVNRLTFYYVSGVPGRLDYVQTADGGKVKYGYDAFGNITAEEVWNGATKTLTRTYYTYESYVVSSQTKYRLKSVTVDLSPNDNSIGDGKTYELRYTYDGSSNRVASITQSDGSALAISYINVSGVYKVSRLTQTVASGETRTTDILYSTSTVGPDTFDVAEVRVYRDATLTGYVSTTLKSIAGQLREVQTAPAASGQTGQNFTYTYDTLGNVVSVNDVTSERGRLTEYAYDSSGNATQITVKLNGSSTPDTTTTRTYVNNNLTQETVTGSTAFSANANLTTRYVYDSENHLRFTISAEGRVSEFEYETTGELKRTIVYKAGLYTTAGQPDEAAMNAWGDANTANAEVKTYEYDTRGGLLRAYGFSATTSFVESTNDGRSQVNNTYDQSGALLSRWVEGQTIETFIYDGLGRLIASTDLSGGITHLHFVDDYFVNSSNAQTVVITRAAFNSGTNDWDATADSLVTTSIFNRVGELITRSEAVGPGGVAPNTGSKTYDYDKLGRLRSVTDATARKTYFLYDDLGRKTADVGQDGQLTEYRYDRAGRLIVTIRYATAISTTNIANAANAVVIGDVRPVYNASDIAQWTIYDANDRVVQTIQGDGSVTAYAYDKLGRLITTNGYYNKVSVTGFWATPPASPVSVTAHAKDFTVRSFYDGDGKLVGALNGEGYLTEHIYDAAGRKIQDVGYANATNVANRASGTFNTLKTGLANVSADRNVRYVYDGQGFLRFTIDAFGGVTEARYWDGPSSSPSLAARQQATGFVRETIVYATALGALGSYDYASVKSAVAALSGSQRVSRFVYNDKAHLVYTVDAAGAVTRSWYDASGRLTKSASYSTLYTTAFSADSSAWKAALDSWSPSNDQTRITRFYYNVRNEAVFIVDAEGYVTGRTYDAEGRITGESRYANKLTVDDNWTWASVNGANKGSARATSSVYDNLGRLQYTIDLAGRFEYFTYYANGARNGKIEGTWANQARTYYYYDQAGKVTRESRATDHSAFAGSLGSTATQLTTASGLQQLVSANGQYRAVLGADGELVLTHNGEIVWRTGTAETVAGATYRLDAQTDGNLVIYRFVGATQTAIWNTGTNGSHSGATFIAISDTGRLTLNKGTAPTSTDVIWSSEPNTSITVAALNPYAANWLDTYFAYDGFGNVIQTTAPNGQVTTMTYDKVGRLLSRTNVVGPQTITESWEYDAFDVVKHTDPMGFVDYSYFNKLGRLTWTADAENYVNQTNYNAFGEVTSSIRYRERATNAASLNATTLPTLVAGDTGLVTSFVYDNLGRVQYVIDAENYVTGTTYNAFGQTLSVTRYANTTATLGPPTTSAADATTEFQYDLLGRVTRNEDALDVAELYGYDAYQRTSVTNKAGGVATNIFDASGLLVQETIDFGGGVNTVNKYEYDARGNLTKKVEAWDQATGTALRTTRYEYDKLDRLTAIYHDARSVVTSADGTTSTVTPTERFYYDKNGNLAGSIDRAGARTFYWYDGIGRLTHKLAPNGAVTAHSYDLNGRVTETKLYATALTPPTSVTASPPSVTANAALDRVTQYVYDKLGRTREAKTLGVRAASHNGTTLSVDAAAGTVSTFYDYDSVSNVVRTTNANGAQSYSYFDKLGRKVTEIDAAGYRSNWTYDANGNATQETRFAGVGSVPSSITIVPPAAPSADATNDRVTNFTYDKMGRRLTETRLNVKVHNTASPGAHTTQNAIITYTYNALGLIATKTEASGDAITYSYDAGGRMKYEIRSTFIDVNGSVATPTIAYSYNGLNDLTTVRAHGGWGAAGAPDERVTTYTYGGGGLLASKTDAAGFKRTYIYDAAGRVRREEYNRLDLTANAVTTEAIGYDYDTEGRITRQGALVKTGGAWSRRGAAIDTVAMKYNAYGEVSERGLAHYDAVTGVESVVYAEKFEYDNAGRLTRTNSGDGAWKYFMYDGAGNQTLAIQSVGTDLNAAATDTLQEVLALWTGGTTTIATTNVTGVIATITRYDARNQAVEVREPQRQRTTTTSDDLTTTRAYTAFGDVAYEINAAGARVDYTYNTMGRRIKVESPAVQGRAENGRWYTGYDVNGALQATSNTAVTFRPVEHFYYDKSGRLVAKRDANTNLTRYTLLAGTGYGGSEALITETFGADGSVTRTKYDVHGDARRIEDALYNGAVSTTAHAIVQNFDKMGRLTSMNRSNVLTDYFAYDGLGQRIKHANSFYNSPVSGNPYYNASFNAANAATWNNAESTTYDSQGRITQVIAMGGDTTSHAYAWDGGLVTTGMSATPFGGWVKTTTYANTKTMVQKSDVFDRDIQKIDLGAHTTNFSYDKAGRLTQSSATHVVNGAAVALGQTLYQTYFNTGRLKEIHQTGGSRTWPGTYGGIDTYTYRGTTFGYDKTGNLTAQVLREAGSFDGFGYIDSEGQYYNPFPEAFDRVISNQSATFDALGRITSWAEAGDEVTVGDAAGDDMPAATHAFDYDANGNIRRSLATYYALNAQGAAAATPTTQDYWYRYDAAHRMLTSKGVFTGSIAAGTGAIGRGATGVDSFYNLDGTKAYTLLSQNGNLREDYVYDAVGRVIEVKSGTNLSAAGAVVGAFSHDAMGRLLTQTDYSMGAVAYSRAASYNAKGQLISDDVSAWRNDDVYRTLSSYAYGTGANYALGAVTEVIAQNWKDGAVWPTTKTTTAYDWYDGAITTSVIVDPDNNAATNNSTGSSYVYHVIGGQARLHLVDIQDGRPRKVWFAADMLGQVFRRDEADNLIGGDPHEVWYRYGGRQQGYVGNNGAMDVAFVTSVAHKQSPPGQSSFADFDLAYDAINAYEQGGRGGVYTVQSGDTLQGIASALWGDASLWWKLAEVNGLTAESTLVEGQLLIIPVGVQTNSNNAQTFQPYDPLEVLGNLSPTAPKPAKGKNCGGFGQILLAVIALAVVLATRVPIMNFFQTAFASIATNAGVTMVTMSAAGVPVLTSAGAAVMTAGAVTGAAAAGALSSIASQAAGVATGIQERFSWNAVALSAIGAGVGAGVGAAGLGPVTSAIASNVITQGIGTATGLQDKFSWAAVAAAGVSRAVGLRFGEGTAGGITAATLADAATRSLIEGSDFGDNMTAALPNMFAQMAMMRPTPRAPVEAQGSSDDSAPYMSYKSNVLNREVANTQPRRDLLSMALDWLGRAIVGDFSVRPVKEVQHPDAGADDLSFTEYDPLTIYAVPRDQYGIPRSAVSMLLNSQRTISDERIRDALARASMEGRPATIQSPLYQPGPLQSPIMMQDRTFEDFSYSDAMIQYESDRAFRRAIAGRDYPMAGVAGGISSAFGADSDTQDTFVVAGVTFDSVAGAWAGPRAFSPTGGRYSPRPLTTPEYDYASVNGMGRHRPYADSRRRPTYASGQVETVWRRHQRDGQVFDPNVGAKLTWYRNQTRAGQWDMGHVPGREYRELHRMYMSGQISLTEFLREYRNPANYRPEQPGANRSRRYEGGN